MQVDPTSSKACPKCQTLCNVMVGQCHRCGHLFRTQYIPGPTPNVGQTQVFSAQLQYAAPPQPQFYASDHSVWAALAIGLVLWPLAPFYNRQYWKGIFVTVLMAVLIYLSVVSDFQLTIWPPVLHAIGILVYYIFLADAVCVAAARKTGMKVKEWDCFPLTPDPLHYARSERRDPSVLLAVLLVLSLAAQGYRDFRDAPRAATEVTGPQGRSSADEEDILANMRRNLVGGISRQDVFAQYGQPSESITDHSRAIPTVDFYKFASGRYVRITYGMSGNNLFVQDVFFE